MSVGFEDDSDPTKHHQMDAIGVTPHEAISLPAVPMSSPAPPTWQAKCARVRVLAARVQTDRDSSASKDSIEPMVAEMLVLLDDEDPLTAFVALGVLRDTIGHIPDPPIVRRCVRRILQSPAPNDLARRFQLVRQLIRVAKHEKNEPSNDSSSDTSDDGETEGQQDLNEEDGKNPHHACMKSVFENMAAFGAMLLATMQVPVVRRDAVHEGIVCLTSIVKISSGIAHPGVADLYGIVQRALECAASWCFGEGAVPTFIACDIIDLVMESRQLYQRTASPSWVVMTCSTLRSPLSSLSIAMLAEVSATSDDSCAESFVAISTRYPLLQKWIQLWCLIMKNALELAHDIPAEWNPFSTDAKLPTRSQLFAVLTEQDDVLVEVVIELLSIARSLDAAALTKRSVYFENEAHPDLVFAQLLQVFGDDHLVLLDMLMSSETRMLEYLLQYLRYATTSWPRSRSTWDGINRTRSVMSTLIRLRMEMERLAEAGVFPYNPAPLLRRLEVLEHHYENEPL